jgi:phosphoserine phosphatase
MRRLQFRYSLFVVLVACIFPAAADPLPSWKASPARQQIISFVDAATEHGGKGFIAPAERIATFDNDGTLWSEQPLYFQAIYAFDAVKAAAPEHPQWKTQEPFASVLKGDNRQALAGGAAALMELVMASHTGNTVDQFSESVTAWLASARHPQTGLRYDEMIYQPMVELLSYLRSNGFKTYIVSGGGVEFIRTFSEQAYGIPPEQVVGSSVVSEYEVSDTGPVLRRKPELFFFDDKGGKPVAIQHHIGRRPVIAVGNSDGDFQMLEWTTSGDGPRLGILVHHTDAEREWAYDRNSHIGALDRGLEEAPQRGWIVVDMKNHWSKVFAKAR